ncbi:GGDEF domain-containing protein [bacterium]|nr:GGDEF domain-containing protein [bacterium]
MKDRSMHNDAGRSRILKGRRSVFRELLVSMLLFGIGVGILFPPFASRALDSPEAMTLHFFAMCIAAGLTVGVANFFLFRFFVSREMRRVVEGMIHINKSVATAEGTGEGCADDCMLVVDSDDLIGEMASAFNDMIGAIGRRISVESETRALLSELSATMDIEIVSEKILDELAGICGATAGVLYADTGNRMELMRSFGVDVTDELPGVLDAGQGLANRALSTGQPLHVAPGRDGFSWFKTSTPFGAMHPDTIGLVPLMAEQRAVGLVALACIKEELDEGERALFDAIRKQSAPYLATAIMHHKVEDLAAVDDLTRLLNRRFGMRRLGEEFSRSVRHGVPVSVIMLDIDNFKRFNDTFGHDAGDTVLVAVSRMLEDGVRSGDIAFRYGGEELLVVAPGMGLNDAAEMAERMRRSIEGSSVAWGDRSLSITVSIGAASWPVARASTPEELVTYADQAMYAAKSGGRNCVMLHDGERTVGAVDLRVPMAENETSSGAGSESSADAPPERR